MTVLQNRTRGQLSFYAGEAAEEIVAREYQRHGYLVDHRRWRGSGGEIDLIVRKSDRVVFVEVKKSRTLARAAERLGRRQMTRIYAAAEQFLSGEQDGQMTNTRFDVALVDATGAIEIIENAFGHD